MMACRQQSCCWQARDRSASGILPQLADHESRTRDWQARNATTVLVSSSLTPTGGGTTVRVRRSLAVWVLELLLGEHEMPCHLRVRQHAMHLHRMLTASACSVFEHPSLRI